MNKVILMGRLTKDPEVRYSQGENQTAICRYTLAVDRPKDKDGNKQADFIGCIAFGKRAEFANKYLQKGTMIAITGRIQTGSYQGNDGKKVYTTDVIVDEHYFCGSGQNNTSSQSRNNDFAPTNERVPSQRTNSTYSGQQQGMNDGFMPIDEDLEGDADLPF